MNYRTASHPQGACPRCLVELDKREIAGMSALTCSKCGGLFAGKAMATSIKQGPDRVLVDAVFALSAGKPERAWERMDAELPCPDCGMAMQRVNMAAAACDIDVCPEHGTWFDPHEFHHVVRALTHARDRKHR